MTPIAGALVGITALIAVADWVALKRSLRRLEYLAKPAVMVGLIAVAIAVHPISSTERVFFCSFMSSWY